MQQPDSQIILFGAGDAGIRTLRQLGKERVCAFCDNYKAGQVIEGKPVVDIHMLEKMCVEGKYQVVISASYPHIICEMAQQLSERHIECTLCEEGKKNEWWDLMHVVGHEVVYVSDTRCSKELTSGIWISLYKQAICGMEKGMTGRKTDFWIYLGDQAEKAYWAVKLQIIDKSHIFSFVTAAGMEDVVIPVPDYMYHMNTFRKFIWDIDMKKCRENAKRNWESEKAYWIGNLGNHHSRKKLYLLGTRFPEELQIESSEQRYVPMTEWYRFKYLVDARGCGGWTDRLKVLFWLGRPIFINERPYIEFWMQYGLEAGRHYISVKEDFSDLIEKKRELDASPDKYRKITKEMFAYAEKYLTKEFALQYLRDVLLKYGIKE